MEAFQGHLNLLWITSDMDTSSFSSSLSHIHSKSLTIFTLVENCRISSKNAILALSIFAAETKSDQLFSIDCLERYYLPYR